MMEYYLQDPTFWVAVAFFIFIGLAGKKIWKASTQALDARAARIGAELGEAARLRQEAEALLADFQRKYHESMKEAEGILAKARQDAERMTKEAEDNLKSSLDLRMQHASEKIAQEEKQALNDVRERIVELAVAATKQLIGAQAGQAHASLVAEATRDIPAKLH